MYTCEVEEYDGTSFCMATENQLAELETPRLRDGPLTKLIGFQAELKSGASVSMHDYCMWIMFVVINNQHYMW